MRCQDLRAPPGQFLEVAVKVQRNNDMMRRAGEKEIMFLQRLVEGDPDNRRHCIHMLDRFDHEDHLCMVFEAMHQVRPPPAPSPAAAPAAAVLTVARPPAEFATSAPPARPQARHPDRRDPDLLTAGAHRPPSNPRRCRLECVC